MTGNPAQEMEIGADEGGGVADYGSPFGLSGSIDEVRVFRGILTPEEIREHATQPANTTAAAAELVAHYGFDDGKATDLSGNGNDGKLYAATAGKGKAGKALRFKGAKKRRRAVLPHSLKYDWVVDIPLHVRAMVLAGQTLFVAGPPDLLDEDKAAQTIGTPETQALLKEQAAAFAGAKGAVLRAVSATDGSTMAEQKLPAMPRWDGLIAAGGKLFVVNVDGSVACLQ